MKPNLPRLAAALATGTAVLFGAGAAQASTLRGTVVHRNARAHSFTVADRSGRMYAIHAARAPRLDSSVLIRARRLRNGTFALQHARTLGRGTRKVAIRGVVTYVNRRAGEFTVSAPGVSILVHGRRRAARAADALPPVGSTVVTTGNLDDQGDLDESSVQQTGTDGGTVGLEGTIVSVDSTARTLTVSADDEDASKQTITVSVPATLDISGYQAGQEAELQVTPNADGTYTLAGSAEDGGATSADDQGEQQGNQGDEGNDTQDDQSSTSTGTSGSDDGSDTTDSGAGTGDGSSSTASGSAPSHD